jgi:predicted MFS family arabinose efflux permease
MVMIGDAALVPATTYFITRDLGLGPEAVGLVVSGFGLGSFGGAVAAGFLTRRLIGLPLLAGNAVSALSLLGLAFTSTLLPMVVLALVAGMAQAVVLVSYVTLRAQVTPDELIGRVGSTGRTVSLGLQPLGFLAAGVLLDLVAGRATLATMALFLLSASILFSFSGTLRGAPAGHPAG